MDNDKNPARSRQPSQDEGSRLLGEPAENGFCLRVKLKVSLCLGTTAVLSFMVFLFLVPFVVDPAVSRLIARYSSEPGTCALHEHVFAAGMSKCTWSSCREGCTSATTRCHQITVNYSLTPYEQYYQDKMRPELLEWAGTVVRFLVNTEGCGYPPFVNCTMFALQYGYMTPEDITTIENINQSQTRELYRHRGGTAEVASATTPMITELKTPAVDDALVNTLPPTPHGLRLRPKESRETADEGFRIFPCYYSRAYPDRVVAEYDWHNTIKMLVAAVVIPWTLFFVSCAVLCYWYCPALKKEFVIDKRKMTAHKTDNTKLGVRRKLSEEPLSTDEDDGEY